MELQLFDEETGRDLRWRSFLQTDLGQLFGVIPWQELSSVFPLKKHPQGRKAWLGVQGGLGLMILKAYLGLSDRQLIERLNCDWSMQLFCGIRLKPVQRIRDQDLVSRWRRYFGQHLDWRSFQAKLASHWKPHLNNTHVVLMDATCYESDVRYPTDIKLLWESSEWVFDTLYRLCKQLGIARPKTKYKHQQSRYMSYARRRRKTKKLDRRMANRLLFWLERGLGLLTDLQSQYADVDLLDEKQYHHLQLIKQVYVQQLLRWEQNQTQIQQRIVSLAKPYLRPIKRGKETKTVEFGAKVHSIQVDGINFVEHLHFGAFNEARRLKSAIWMHRDYFGKCKQLGGDEIYATNANRRYCAGQGIHTCFKRKGRASKVEDQAQALRKAIGKERATRLEGSFGCEKQFYGLQSIKARTQATETVWILFGIWTASARRIAHRIQQQQNLTKAA